MKPIIFNTEMVKAILDGRKTSFRLPIKLKDNSLICTGYIFSSTDRKRNDCYSFGKNKECDMEYVKPKYKVDDILYVKETFAVVNGGQYIFKADDNKKKYESIDLNIKWTSAVHLTQNESRIFLKVTNVRVERLQDITFGDIEKESYPHEVLLHHRILKHKAISVENKHEEDILNWWINNWNSTLNFHNGIRKSQNILNKYNWEDNPYVFVYEFEIIEK